MRVLGIDEAGRGCVLGALYVGAFVADGVDDRLLLDAGAADSKALTHPKRLRARALLAALGQADVLAIPAAAIDEGNLNTLEEDAIVALVLKWKPDRVVIDALGHPRTLPKVLARLQSRARATEWLMEPKADVNHPVVGAASIFAKTDRDAALALLAKKHGELGSGYPGDPTTKAWLAKHHAKGKAWPAFVRTKWATIQNLTHPALF